jgi:hypothetical protein
MINASTDVLKNRPTGGFPPIFSCKKEIVKESDNIKTRGFTADEKKTIVSMKDIIDERRKEIKPFII